MATRGDPDLLLTPFLDAIAKTGPRCTIARIRDGLDGDRRAQFDAAIDSTDSEGRWRIPGTVVAEVVTGWGFKLGDQSVTRHRKGACSCR